MRVDSDELASPSSASSPSSSAPARRTLRIFKEPSSSSSISQPCVIQIIWTPKSSPQLQKSSVESAIFFASSVPQPKLSNASCTSLLHDAPPIYETGKLELNRLPDVQAEDLSVVFDYSEFSDLSSDKDPSTSRPSNIDCCDDSTLRRSCSQNEVNELDTLDTDNSWAADCNPSSSSGPISDKEQLDMPDTVSQNQSHQTFNILSSNGVASDLPEKRGSTSVGEVTDGLMPTEECVASSSDALEAEESLHSLNNDQTVSQNDDNPPLRSHLIGVKFPSCSALNSPTISIQTVRETKRRVSEDASPCPDGLGLHSFLAKIAEWKWLSPKYEETLCQKTFRSPTPNEKTYATVEIQEETAKIKMPVKAIVVADSPTTSSSSDGKDEEELGAESAKPLVSQCASEPSSPPSATYFEESFNTVADSTAGMFDSSNAADGSPVTLSASTPAPMFKCIRRLTVGIVQLRGFSALCAMPYVDDTQLNASVKLDSNEVFQSAPVPATANCTFGVETACDLPADFNAVHVILTQMANGQRISCPIGRVSVTRRELLDGGERFTDVWLPIFRIVGAPCTEVLGDMCIDMSFNASTHVLSVQIIDYTIWQRAAKSGKHDSNNNNQHNANFTKSLTQQQQSHQQQENQQHSVSRTAFSGGTLRRGASVGGETPAGDALEYLGGVEQLYARMCVSASSARYSPMKKLHVVERRAVEVAHLNCGQLLAKLSTSSSASVSTVSTGRSESPSAVPTAKKAPPRPPPPRLPPNYAAQKMARKPFGSFDALEQELQLSRSGSGGTKSRPKARSRLLSSSASVSHSDNSVVATTAENPLRPDGKPARKTRASKSTNADDEKTSPPHRPNGWQSTSSIPDSYVSWSTSAGDLLKQQHRQSQQQQMEQQLEKRRSPLKLRLNIKLYRDACYDESSYCGYVRVPLDEATMLPKGQPLGPNWFNIKSRSAIAGGETAAAQPPAYAAAKSAGRHADATPHDTANRRFVASLDTPPLHFRHTSTLSTSAGDASGATSTAAEVSDANLKSLGSLRGSALSVSNGTTPIANYHITFSTAKSTVSTSKPVVHVDNASHSFSVTSSARMATSAERVGEMRLRLRYSVDEILPLVHYQPLYTNLINSLNIKPYSASLTSILQYLPISVESIARTLMKIFVHANQIRAFLRLTCAQYVSSCQADVNTLFRSHTLASKVVCELMDFIGQDYLIVTLKPLIDLIYAERKCCEIDPAKMRTGDSLDQNMVSQIGFVTRNLIVYAELAFSRIIDSRCRFPRVLRDVFAELRATVVERFSGREDVSRLAVSSFLMLRYFSAAILHPKHFALRQDAPEADVSRTLVLISKILQRLANCVVSAHPLFTKEEWLTPVMQRFLDEAHKRAMTRFLDAVSRFPASDATGEAPDSDEDDVDHIPLSTDRPPVCCCEPDIGVLAAAINANTSSGGGSGLSLSCHELRHSYSHRMPALLKHGHMIERRCGSDKKNSFKNLIHQKRRYVTLTETQLSWQKASSGSVADLHHLSLQQHHSNCAAATVPRKSDTKTTHHNSLHHAPAPTPPGVASGTPGAASGQQKGYFVLSDITSVSPLTEAKNSFRVVTPHSEVHFQANSISEMNEWMILIQKQQRRHVMLLNRSSSEAPRVDNGARTTVMSRCLSEGCVDEVDMEREMQIVHVRLLEQIETLRQWRAWLDREHAALILGNAAASSVGTVQLPVDQIFSNATTTGEREVCLARLYETIVSTIAAIQQIEDTHQTARNLAYQMKVLRQQNNNKNIADNNIVVLPTRLQQQQQYQNQQRQKDVGAPKKAQTDAKNAPIAMLRPGAARRTTRQK